MWGRFRGRLVARARVFSDREDVSFRLFSDEKGGVDGQVIWAYQ